MHTYTDNLFPLERGQVQRADGQRGCRVTEVTLVVATVTWEVFAVPWEPTQDPDVTVQPCSLRVSLS